MFLFHSYYAKQNKYIPQEKVINHHLWKEMCIPFFVCKKEVKNIRIIHLIKMKKYFLIINEATEGKKSNLV